MGESSLERITRTDLRRLARIAADDREDFFARHAEWRLLYARRLLCSALRCAGKAPCTIAMALPASKSSKCGVATRHMPKQRTLIIAIAIVISASRSSAGRWGVMPMWVEESA